jgi:DNA-binding NarL/FixJ family response regulator
MAIRVIIADDHRLVREGLRHYLTKADEFEVVGEASDGQELVSVLEKSGNDLDLALIDTRMPEVNGPETVRWIRDRHPRVGVVMLVPSDDLRTAADAVEAGARGYVLKTAERDDLIRTLRVAAGQPV